MTHPAEDVAVVVILIVAVIALFLTTMAYRSVRRSGNKRLLFVTGAFGLLAIRGFLVAYSMPSHFIEHGMLELVSSIFDLAIVVLLALPLFR